jgi:hypothetical protein
MPKASGRASLFLKIAAIVNLYRPATVPVT